MEGAEFDDVVKRAYAVRDAMCALFCFETLFFRDKGGRIFKAKPWAEAEENSGAGFKAMIEVDHSTGGTVNLVSRARAKKQLVRKMPVEKQVADWVDQAKKLPRKVSY